MKKRILLAVALLLAFDATAAQSQGRRGGRRSDPGWGFTPLAHRAEITGYGGYFWHTDYDVYFGNPSNTGKLDIKSNAFWGVELDVNVRPGAQVALIYNRSDTELQFKPALGSMAEAQSVDAAVEYWHIGGLSGVSRGNVMPFGGVTFGATRYSFEGDDAWKFSLMPQLGVKIFPNERIGIRGQARLPLTIVNGGFAVGGGTGGGFVSVGGETLVQFDFSGGIMILI